jgi:hypothetical protein
MSSQEEKYEFSSITKGGEIKKEKRDIKNISFHKF